ncbi:MAG: AbrB/MazE/SpoVT family DNA-binding domain-containing protein [Chloroflexi bacterium]|nr:AbrB/MazE/SpoVT family DNA-binding domain-containing protein [Chloroflexota bacterium]
MKTKIQKWGNSLALRIPKSFAREVGLDSNSPVDVLLQEGKLVVVPETGPRFSLEELLQQVTEDNLHGEVGWGAPVGREIW